MHKALACLIAYSLLAGCASKEPDGRTRAGLTAVYELVLEGNDANDDGKLSRDEVEAMVASTFPDDPKQTPENRKIGHWLIQDYAAQDADRDGFLSLAELLKEPLAIFTCVDTNSDEFISHSEIQAGMDRCGNGRPYLAS